MNELATKGDIQQIRMEMGGMELRLVKWMIGIVLTQTAVLIAICALLK